MKTINNYITEKLVINKKIKNQDSNLPKKGTIAWDYNGEAWEILDFCPLNDKPKLDKLLKKYDMFGTFKDFLDAYGPNEYDENILAVAAQEKDSGVETVWVWGSEGICYDNKD